MISGKAILAGVIGDPVSHSLSPKLHNRWIGECGLDAAYVPLHVKPADLAEAFRALPKLGFKGWNITVPHKEAALKLVDEADAAAKAIGAVNTVIVRDGRLYGRNTDAEGFVQNLKAHVKNLEPYKDKAVIVGAGGAARAIAKALTDEGFKKIVLVNRTEKNAWKIVTAMRHALHAAPWDKLEEELHDAHLLVNATVLGMEGHKPLVFDIHALPVASLVADIVYTPPETELLKSARAHGCATVSGIGMLIRQAVPGFKAWFGVEPKVTPDLEKFLLA